MTEIIDVRLAEKRKSLWVVIAVAILGGLMVSPSTAQIVLPVEVVGASGYTDSRTFTLASTAGIDSLWLQANNLGYVRSKAAKGSVRVNGESWIDLDDTTVNCYYPDRKFHCTWGYNRTIKFAVAVSGLVVGSNTIDFRYIASDGNSSGWTVLDFNLLAGGVKQLDPVNFREVDPSTWTFDAGKAPAGKTLFDTSVITTSDIDATPLRSKCVDCHMKGGRDLKILNYSDKRIIARSVFHGLSTSEGEEIAAYIRSHSAKPPVGARPWSPIYQPGPGLDAKDHAGWFAGAGLDYVLATDAEALPYYLAAVDSLKQFHGDDITRGDLNMRELPMNFQLPDWNQWTPTVHPVDLDAGFMTGDAMTKYNQFYADLENPAKSIWDLTRSYESFLGASTFAGSNPGGSLQGCVEEHAFRTWKLMKSVEMAFEYEKYERAGFEGIEFVDLLPSIYPKFGDGRAHGEVRGFPGIRSAAFGVAPHRTCSNDNDAPYLKEINSEFSSAWYRNAVVMNPGHRYATEQNVIDWKYQSPHISSGTWSDNNYPQAVYSKESALKMLQQFNKDLCPIYGFGDNATSAIFRSFVNMGQCAFGNADDASYGMGWQWRIGNPSTASLQNVASGGLYDVVDAQYLTKEQARQLLEPIVLAHIIRTEDFSPDDWEREDNNQLKLASANSVCRSDPDSGYWMKAQEESTQLCRLIPYWKDLGIATSTLQRWADWAEMAWPLNDFDALVSRDR